jgi:hypothetical protein
MNTLAIINPNNAIATRTYKNSETRTYGGALKFNAFCESEGLDNSNSTHADRVLRHSKHCNEVNSNGQAVQSLAQKEGLVFDKVSVNTDSNGIRRMTMSYIKIAVPKERVRKEAKLAKQVEGASPEVQAEIAKLLAKHNSKAIDIAS